MHEEEEGGLTVAGVGIVIKLGLGLGLEERAPRMQGGKGPAQRGREEREREKAEDERHFDAGMPGRGKK